MTPIGYSNHKMDINGTPYDYCFIHGAHYCSDNSPEYRRRTSRCNAYCLHFIPGFHMTICCIMHMNLYPDTHFANSSSDAKLVVCK